MSHLEETVESLRCFPNEFQRELRLICALDVRVSKLAHAAERLENSLLHRASKSALLSQTPSHAEASLKTKRVTSNEENSIENDLVRLRRMHQDLLDLHEEKCQITVKVKEMVRHI
jgi:hypothetical protein